MGGFKEFLAVIPLPAVDWPEAAVPPFFNVNTPDDLRQAEQLVGAGLG
jgi:molybdopterin-guanine dinucleotide biosynthesis protein A